MPQIFAPLPKIRTGRPLPRTVRCSVRAIRRRSFLDDRSASPVASCMMASSLISVRDKLAREPAFVHHEHPVGQAENFLHFTRCKQNGNALTCQLIHKFIDFLFRPNIDAARRLVEQQQFGLKAEPFPEHDLLLVAAGQVANRLAGRWKF